jgi:hypothetical protein
MAASDETRDDARSSGPSITRRDFLASAGLTVLSFPLIARAAFAQGAPSGPPADATIARLAIFPALGISRVGNSAEWFLAPEVPGIPPLPDGRYKEGTGKVKKQVQRFRVYAFNQAGQVVREVTAAEADIEWTVHVANTKAAWYGFNNPLDNRELAPGLPSQMRNQFIVGDAERAAMLVIDPGPKSIRGANTNPGGTDPAYDMVGRFWRQLDVKLGHLQTDAAGRLLVFTGDGVSQSALPNNPISNFSDNDGWHDDWCDGPVQARLTFKDGTVREAEGAWVASCGPDFAPDTPPFISLYDVLTDVNVGAGWSEPPKPPLSFRKYIYPLFHGVAVMDWVAAAANLHRAWIDVGNFDDPAYLAKLADPSPGNRPFRQHVFDAFRNPDSNDQQQYTLPYMLGDGVNYSASPIRWFRIPKLQYGILQAWVEGQFVADLDFSSRDEIAMLEQMPLAEQPEALTRAALEPCSGGAFHPGVELTWPLRHREVYSGPFRVALSKERTPSLVQNLGLLLTPEKAFGGDGSTPPAIAPQMPGDLTRWMGIPWQCDAFSCQQVVFANDFPNATWWPASLPIDVLPQLFYDQVMNPELSAADRVKFVNSRAAWSRGVAGIGYHAQASYTDGLNQMIYLWNQMGFIVRRPGPTDPGRPLEIPSVLYVEVDRGSMNLQRGAPSTREAPPA